MEVYVVKAEKLTKRFGNNTVLNSVDLSIPKGEIAGLVGNNGSGKSVLLKCLSGLLLPTSGIVSINGAPLDPNKCMSTEVGALIEAPGFLPNLSGYSNLKALWSLNKRVPVGEVAHAMSRVGLNPKDKRPVGKYSMGMRQRLGIAQAIMEKPGILFLDEPFNGLDKHGVRDMYDFMMSLKRSGITAIIASHNPSDIRSLCEPVYEIDNGQLSRVC